VSISESQPRPETEQSQRPAPSDAQSPPAAEEPVAPPSDATAEPRPAPAPDESSARAETLSRRLHRLALDVHDGPMQNLTAIGFSLGELRRTMLAALPPEQQPRIAAGLERITVELGSVEGDLRKLIGALESGIATSLPLREAVEAEISEFESRTGVPVEFIFEESAQAETDSQRIALQSVTRAALTNVAKHAHAAHVTVRLHGDGHTTTLQIEDDGVGFRADTQPEPGHFGLDGMRRRVELLGGEFSLATKPGGPTLVSVSLQVWRPDDDV
jgi:signal transduction histidine kinase